MSGNVKKQQILGMAYGTACHRLRQQIMFSLVKQTGQDVCFVCQKLILTVGEMSIEHKDPWLEDPERFWDLSNVAFSHRRCNRPHTYAGGRQTARLHADGTWLCIACDQYLEEEAFSFYTPSPTRKERRPRSRCKACRAERRKQGLPI